MSGSEPLLPYLRDVLHEQDAFRQAAPSILPRAVRRLAAPVGRLTNRVIPPELIEAAIRGADWAASGSIRKSAINHDFTDLAACDEAAAEVRRWALGYAVTGGGAAGAFGALGMAVDIPATVTLALRTARLTSLCYGFGANSDAERVYILGILQLAGANSRDERDEMIRRLGEDRSVMEARDWQTIVDMTGHSAASAAATHKVATTLGINLSTRKLGQILPVVGAAIGAGVNAAFQNDVTSAARFAGRSRWLVANEGIVENLNAIKAEKTARR